VGLSPLEHLSTAEEAVEQKKKKSVRLGNSR
jgi:hypothetical protein